MSCIACCKPLNGSKTCPRCGFKPAPSIGNPAIVRKMLEEDAAAHRRSYLHGFDFGITCHYWKDLNGAIVLDTTKRLSFGTGDQLFDNTVWLEQEFARMDDAQQLTIEVSIQQQGAPERTIPCQIPALNDPLLQRLGLSLGLHEVQGQKELCLTLTLKNEKTKVFSKPVPFLPG